MADDGFYENSACCTSCGSANPKYRCPQCNRRSCSLECVKSHKLKSDCTGQRNKTKFIIKSEYNHKHLLNDYRFLEEVNRVADNAIRDHRNKPKFFSRNAKQLQSKAAQRGIKLKLMPVGFKKRMENTTCWRHRGTKAILWRMKWIFPQADAEYVESRVSEKVQIKMLLEKYLDPSHADPVVKQKLKMYHKGSPDDIGVFLQNHATSNTRFFKINKSDTVEDALKGKVIIEYPAFHVVLSHYFQEYLTDSPCPAVKRLRLEEYSAETYQNPSENSENKDGGVLFPCPRSNREACLVHIEVENDHETELYAKTSRSCVLNENFEEGCGQNLDDAKDLSKKSKCCLDELFAVAENSLDGARQDDKADTPNQQTGESTPVQIEN